MPNLSRIDPRTIAGLFAWYDATAVTGFGGTPPADGTGLAQWNDLSGNGRHLLQGTGANQPLYRATGALNGLPAVETVDSTDNMGIATAGAGTRPQTILAVIANKLADDAAFHRAVLFNNGQVGIGLQWTGSVDAFAAVDSGGVTASQIAGDLNTWHVASYTPRTLGLSSEVAVDGMNTAVAGVTGTDTDRTINMSQPGAGGFIGLYAELLIFTTDLPRSLRNALEQSLAEKWGFLPRFGLRG